jgi:hypothetical protein
MKLRQHRGGLDESLATTIEIEPTRNALLQAIKQEMGFSNVYDKDISITYYGYDARIEWETYIVEIDGFGVYGFTNGPVQC